MFGAANAPHTVWASLLAFACILVVLALLLSIPFILARLRGSHPRVDRFMDSAAHWMGAAPLPHPPKNSKEPAPNSFLRSLKATKYAAPVGGNGGADVEAGAVEDCCAICCCDYEQGQPVIALKCSHMFHKECITAWLKVDAVCPICKTKLLPQRNTAPDCQCAQQGQTSAAAQPAQTTAGATATTTTAAAAAPPVASPPAPPPVAVAAAASTPVAAAPAAAAHPASAPRRVHAGAVPALQVHALSTPMLGVAGVSP